MPDIDLTIPVSYGLPPGSDGLPFATDDTPLELEKWRNCWTVIEMHLQGLLDGFNIRNTQVEAESTRRGALVQGWSCGGTASLDYLKYLYAHVDQTDTATWSDSSNPDAVLMHETYIASGAVRMDAIPGASHSFILTKPAYVLLQWNIFWVSEIPAIEGRVHSHVALVVNGQADAAFVRSVSESTVATVRDYEVRELQGFEANRHWHGHRLLRLNPGEHHVSLQHVCHQSVPSSRVWCRGMRATIYHQTALFE